MTTYSDLFTRADSALSAGPDWTNRRNVMGVTSNAARAVTGNNDSAATFNTPLGSDDFLVTITVLAKPGGFNPPVRVGGGCSTGGDGAFVEFVNGADFVLKTMSANWDPGAATGRLTVNGQTLAAGNTLSLQRVGNVYTILKNGGQVGSTWTDSGGALTIDSNHRLAMIGGQEFIGDYWPIDMFEATDTVGGGGGPTYAGSFAAYFM